MISRDKTRLIEADLPDFLVGSITPETINERMVRLEERPWTIGQYKKENWGNRLHALAPYIARIKPAFAHWLIRIFSKAEDIVLDPFCGIGTVPLECDLLRRKALGADLNPYAVAIARAKFDRRPLEENLVWLRNVKLKTDDVDLDSIPAIVRKFYHEKTLREILALRNEILHDRRNFLLGCLLAISHGHRPQYLSTWTGYIIPFEPRTKPEYRAVLPRMMAKAKRMYEDGIPPSTEGEIFKADARKLPLAEESVDVVISSPPYFDTIDYVGANWLRSMLLGLNGSQISELKKDLIQQEDNYLSEMESVGKELLRILKHHSLCVFVLGDLHKGEIMRNTAAEISELYEKIGFEMIGVVEDEIPLARRTAVKWHGRQNLEKRKSKFDRVLVMKR